MASANWLRALDLFGGLAVIVFQVWHGRAGHHQAWWHPRFCLSVALWSSGATAEDRSTPAGTNRMSSFRIYRRLSATT